jgi:hypothetical protein
MAGTSASARLSGQFQRPVIVAMAIMWMMQPSVDEVIDVIPVGNAFVSAARSMRVRAPGVGRAARGIGIADLDNVFVNMILMRVMQMTIVEVVDVAMMAHSRMSAVRTMLVGMIRMMMLGADGHGFARRSWELILSSSPDTQRELDTTVCPLRDTAMERFWESCFPSVEHQ